MRHRRPDRKKAATRLKAWANRLRPATPADLYNDMLRGAACKLGGSVAAVLIVWIQNRP